MYESAGYEPPYLTVGQFLDRQIAEAMAIAIPQAEICRHVTGGSSVNREATIATNTRTQISEKSAVAG